MPEEQIQIRPVGVIKNKVKKPFLKPEDSDLKLQKEIDAIRKDFRKSCNQISEIIINKDIADILDGVEAYSHLVVLYWAHQVPKESRRLTKVHPMGRKETPLSGIFSTCSPARPNPLLMSIVRLCAKKENVLQVKGLDAIDGSPVIDIKPYVKEFYPQKDVLTPDWMQKLCQEMNNESYK
ncbi:MAG: tRNA (N6-threonylcarbamoyladenosine(37)-N6)-methyltransferase TrmO [Candidatus Bathyarchaeota archaeon]|nr:tRNA (N6-threonylcarbamoyladenosine(37)-N6)-methyltransferase TrmO [Candidatus Bathyarchaeota archaeon]